MFCFLQVHIYFCYDFFEMFTAKCRKNTDLDPLEFFSHFKNLDYCIFKFFNNAITVYLKKVDLPN